PILPPPVLPAHRKPRPRDRTAEVALHAERPRSRPLTGLRRAPWWRKQPSSHFPRTGRQAPHAALHATCNPGSSRARPTALMARPWQGLVPAPRVVAARPTTLRANDPKMARGLVDRPVQ